MSGTEIIYLLEIVGVVTGANLVLAYNLSKIRNRKLRGLARAMDVTVIGFGGVLIAAVIVVPLTIGLLLVRALLIGAM